MIKITTASRELRFDKTVNENVKRIQLKFDIKSMNQSNSTKFTVEVSGTVLI
jgi:hypothetical protein